MRRAKTLKQITRIRFLKEPKPGEKGATLRGPLDWDSLSIGFQFQNGEQGQLFIDIVYYNGLLYQCVHPHPKGNNAPGSEIDTRDRLWRVCSGFDFVATKIFFATYALVKNLGVEAIEMKDTQGNILFRVRDGKVEAKTGTFENVVIKGNIVADTLDLSLTEYAENTPVAGSLISGGGNYVLPELPPNVYRIIYWFYPIETRIEPYNSLSSENTNVFICKGMDPRTASQNLRIDQYGAWKLLGVNHKYVGKYKTYWYVISMT